MSLNPEFAETLLLFLLLSTNFLDCFGNFDKAWPATPLLLYTDDTGHLTMKAESVEAIKIGKKNKNAV